MTLQSRHPMKAAIAAIAATFVLAMPATAEPVKIRVGWSNMLQHMIPIYFAKTDVLKHYGKTYTLEQTKFNGSSPQISALAADQIDVSTMSPGAMALAINNANLDLRMFADTMQSGHGHKNEFYLVKKDSGITKVADLKGKRIATNVQGSALDVSVRLMLKSGGLDPERDVSMIETRIPEAPVMLSEGKVSFAPIVEPFASKLVASGNFLEIANQDEITGGPVQLVFLAAKTDFIAKNRAALVDFTEDYVRAMRWFSDPANRAEMLKIVSKEAQVPEERLGSIFTKADGYRDPWGEPSTEGAQRAIDGALSVKMLNASIQMTKYTDLSLVREARKRIEDAK